MTAVLEASLTSPAPARHPERRVLMEELACTSARRTELCIFLKAFLKPAHSVWAIMKAPLEASPTPSGPAWHPEVRLSHEGGGSHVLQGVQSCTSSSTADPICCKAMKAVLGIWLTLPAPARHPGVACPHGRACAHILQGSQSCASPLALICDDCRNCALPDSIASGWHPAWHPAWRMLMEELPPHILQGVQSCASPLTFICDYHGNCALPDSIGHAWQSEWRVLAKELTCTYCKVCGAYGHKLCCGGQHKLHNVQCGAYSWTAGLHVLQALQSCVHSQPCRPLMLSVKMVLMGLTCPRIVHESDLFEYYFRDAGAAAGAAQHQHHVNGCGQAL